MCVFLWHIRLIPSLQQCQHFRSSIWVLRPFATCACLFVKIWEKRCVLQAKFNWISKRVVYLFMTDFWLHRYASTSLRMMCSVYRYWHIYNFKNIVCIHVKSFVDANVTVRHSVTFLYSALCGVYPEKLAKNAK